MASASTNATRFVTVTAGFAVAALALSGCAGSAGEKSSEGKADTITIGTTDKVTSLDPAGSYDNGSFAVQNQVFPFLMNTPYGSPDVEPDIAASAEFTAPTEYTVTLKEGLTFANGNELTSSDVKFSFDRQVAIADDNGPSSLLGNLASTEAPDDLTVVFTLKSENDQTFPQILSSPAGPIVDEESFSADALTPDDDIVEAKAFAGQYTIESYDFNNLISYKANSKYDGLLPAAETETVNVKYYTDDANLKLDVQQGNIDVAFRSLSATDVADLKKDDKVNVVDGPGGETRYMVFNFDTMPYGATTAEADAAKALAVRQAAASLIDRQAIADDVYKGTFTPLYSVVPDGLTGATDVLKSLYGDGNGGPSVDKATEILEAAGVETPVAFNLQYNGDHYGPSSGDEYAAVKSQLEDGGLFKVNLQQTEWVQYSKDRTSDVYPVYQLGWYPDYSDADNYLTPFFIPSQDAEGNMVPGGFLKNHFENPAVTELVKQQASTVDPAERQALIEQVQELLAADLSTLPLLQGAQVAVTGTDVEGTTLDASFKFRYAPITKG